MAHFSHLWLFFLMVLAVIVLPGMDMAFVMVSAMTGGRRMGFMAVAGVVAGGICHVAAAALGLGLLLQAVPGLLNAMLLAGSVYIAWIGVSLMRSTTVFGALPAINAPRPPIRQLLGAIRCPLSMRRAPAASLSPSRMGMPMPQSSHAATGAGGSSGACPRGIWRVRRPRRRQRSARFPRKRESPGGCCAISPPLTTGSPARIAVSTRWCTTSSSKPCTVS